MANKRAPDLAVIYGVKQGPRSLGGTERGCIDESVTPVTPRSGHFQDAYTLVLSLLLLG